MLLQAVQQTISSEPRKNCWCNNVKVHGTVTQQTNMRSIFEGSSGQMAFTCCLPLLAGQNTTLLVSWSIQHGGPGIPVLSEQQYHLMLDGDSRQWYENLCLPDLSATAFLQAVSISLSYQIMRTSGNSN